MRTFPPVGLFLCFLVSATLAHAQTNETAVRLYGLAAGPVEYRIETEVESGPLLLSLALHTDQGKLTQLLRPTQLLADDARSQAFSCLALIRGQMAKVRLSLDHNGDSLHWQEPKILWLAEGIPLSLAGKYPRLSDDALMRGAKTSLAKADEELNRLLNRLRDAMSTESFEALRANQREWLRYRDDFIVDDDNLDLVGPESLTFVRNQATRTLDRARFLAALAEPKGQGPGGLYSDGIDRVLALSEVPGRQEALFALRSDLPRLHNPALWEPAALSGSATPVGDGEWRVNIDMHSGLADGATDVRLRFMATQDRRGILVASTGDEGAGPSLFAARFYRVGALDPAREPMRGILLKLPARVFDHTTDGLDESDKSLLATAGTAAIYRLARASADFLQVVYSQGSITFRRFAEHDGGAVIAVATQNLRAGRFELWRLPADGAAPVLLPLDQALARPVADAAIPYPEVTSPRIEFVSYSLAPDMAEIAIQWRESDSEEDQMLHLTWDGHGFGPVEHPYPQ